MLYITICVLFFLVKVFADKAIIARLKFWNHLLNSCHTHSHTHCLANNDPPFVWLYIGAWDSRWPPWPLWSIQLCSYWPNTIYSHNNDTNAKSRILIKCLGYRLQMHLLFDIVGRVIFGSENVGIIIEKIDYKFKGTVDQFPSIWTLATT